jgi:hypothetical protein
MSENMSENAFASCLSEVSAALLPLLRDAKDGDLGFRWSLARIIQPLADELASGSHSPHVEVLRLFEIQFGLRLALSRFHDGLAFKKQSQGDMQFVEEVTCADAAITEATRSLLNLPAAARRRSALCLIKSAYGLSFLECTAIALLAVVSASHVAWLRQLYSGRDGVDKKSVLEIANMSLYEFDALFREERSIVKDGMVSVEGDYSVFVTQAPAFIKVLYGVSLTGEEKDGLRHTVFYTAQFRSDLHAASRSDAHSASLPSTPSARNASGAAAAASASGDDSSSSSGEDEVTSASAAKSSAIDPEDDVASGGNVPPSAVKASRAECLGDDTPSSAGFCESLSPYRFESNCCALCCCCLLLVLISCSAVPMLNSWRKNSSKYR